MKKALRYTDDHEWIEPDTGLCGITDHAQKMLKTIVFVDLPKEGTVLKKGQHAGTVESVKALTDIHAPVSGAVTEVNRTLEDEPELINREPYGKGWIFKIDAADKSEISDLMDENGYEEYTV